MKTFLTGLLLFALGLGNAVFGQDISGETAIVPGQSYAYSYAGSNSCNYPTYSWSVTGGVVTAGSGTSLITVTWDCSAPTRRIAVDVNGEEYDPEYGRYYSVFCGSGALTNFSISSPVAGSISLAYYNNFLQNEVCPNQPFALNYGSSLGVQQVTWSRWDGTSWQAAGTSYGPDFTLQWAGIAAATTFKAQPVACGGGQLASQTFVVQVADNAAAGGVALGARDVLFGNNEGVVTLADCKGIVPSWQQSVDGGATWTDLADNGEELRFSDLTTTTSFRAKSYFVPCDVSVYSEPCTIRVDAGASSLSWIENKSYDEAERVVSNSRSYFDLSGRLLQSQAKNLSQGKILATQPLYGQYDQAVGSTLAAPILETEFTYQPNFVTPSANAAVAYDYTHFDSGAKTNNPDGVGSGTPGTLGWYYSQNNTLEPATASTAYPYSRTEEAPDGSTGVARSSGVGEALRLGQGHDNVQGSFAVRAELDSYLKLRNRYFSPSVIGEQVSSLNGAATQQVSVNSNGQKAVSFQDKEGHTVATARPGVAGDAAQDWLGVDNTVEIGWPYCFVKKANELYENPRFEATADIIVYDEDYSIEEI